MAPNAIQYLFQLLKGVAYEDVKGEDVKKCSKAAKYVQSDHVTILQPLKDKRSELIEDLLLPSLIIRFQWM